MYASIRIPLSHHHRKPHRASNDEHHLLAPPPRHGRLSSLQAGAARRRPRGRDARIARGRVCLRSARADDGDGRDDGLAAVGERTRVHDGAGGGRLCLAARGGRASGRGCDGVQSAADGGDDDEAYAVGTRDDLAACEGG